MRLRLSVFCPAALLLAAVLAGPRDARPQQSAEARHNRQGLDYYNEAFYNHTPKGNQRLAERYFGLAAEEFKQAVALNPGYTEAHRNLARLYYVRRQYAEAAQAYLAVTRLEPRDLDACVQLALAYTQLDRYREALEQLTAARARTTDPEIIARLDGYIRKIRERR